MKKIMAMLLVLCMVFACAACGGNPTGTNSDAGNTTSGGAVKDPNSGVRVDANGNLLYRPEDIGELDNPIVSTLLSPPQSEEAYAQNIAWKEEHFGIEMKTESAPWTEREMKWVSAYVSGTAYDVVTFINFPTAVIKGLFQPLDDLLPLEDGRYFNKKHVWAGKTYGAQPIPTGLERTFLNELYGVWYNVDYFADYGVDDPLTLWENGQWDYEHFYEAVKSMTIDTDRDGKNDIIGCATHFNQFFTMANGAKTVTYTDTGIDLTWNDPKYIEGLEWYLKCKPFMASNDSTNMFLTGKAAMHVERVQVAQNAKGENAQYEFEWVPLPQGPSGSGYAGSVGTGAWTHTIGAGAKNIEGALVYICADIDKFSYVDQNEMLELKNVDDAMFERAESCLDNLIDDGFGSIGSMGNKMWNVWGDLATAGAKGAIEKYTPVMQKEIDNLLATEKVPDPVEYKSPGTVDFEDGNVMLKEKFAGTLSITEDANEVISGSKSLKIQLAADNAFGPVAITTDEHFALPYGSSIKATLKVKAVGGTANPTNTFLVQFRPSGALETGDDTETLGGYNPVDLSDGQVHEVEVMINIANNYDDLQLFIIGNTDENAPNLALIIDDLTIEKIEA